MPELVRRCVLRHDEINLPGLDRAFVDKLIPSVLSVDVVKALANERRLQILAWLKQPGAHFPPQVDGGLVKDGVCAVFIAQKLGVSQPTASEHLQIRARAGLVRAKRIKQWTFYRRDEKRIASAKTGVPVSLVEARGDPDNESRVSAGGRVHRYTL